jgi:hypothetical protein
MFHDVINVAEGASPAPCAQASTDWWATTPRRVQGPAAALGANAATTAASGRPELSVLQRVLRGLERLG